MKCLLKMLSYDITDRPLITPIQTNTQQTTTVLNFERRSGVTGLALLLLNLDLFVRLEEELQFEHTRRRVPLRHEFIFCFVDLLVGNLESDVLVGRGGEHQVLEVLIGRLHLLLERTHEAITRLQTTLDFGILNLEEETKLIGRGVLLLHHLISRSSNLDRTVRNDLCNGSSGRSHRLVSTVIEGLYTSLCLKETDFFLLDWPDVVVLVCVPRSSPPCCVQLNKACIRTCRDDFAANMGSTVYSTAAKTHLRHIGRFHGELQQTITLLQLTLGVRDTSCSRASLLSVIKIHIPKKRESKQ